MARTQGSYSEITGPRVHEAATRLFARNGFGAVSMRDIAREVGVQAGALYNYTPDKQTLLYTLLRVHMEEVLEAWAAEPRPATPLAQLEVFTRFHISFHLSRPDAVFISYMELRSLAPENFKALEALRQRYETELETILRRGVQRGEMRVADTKLAALAIIAMLTGVNTWYREGGRLEKGDVQEVYWNMVRGAVGAWDLSGGPHRIPRDGKGRAE